MSVKFIEDKNDIIAFFPESSRFFKVNEETRAVIEQIEQGLEFCDLSIAGLTEEIYRSIKESVESCNTPLSSYDSQKEKRIGRLALHLTNKCNLKCRYCYANGGIYKSEEGVMDEAIAKKALDCFYKEAHSIGLVQLFGGEPAMNVPLIEYVCEYVTRKNEDREYKTEIGIVTNGTIMSDEIIELVKKYDIKVTVSYDGEPDINDKLRMFKSGTGTSQLIIDNIKKLKEATGQPCLIEATYTKFHTKAGMSIMDITKSIHENIGEIPLHIVPAGGVPDCDYVLEDRDEFTKSIDEMFQLAEDFPQLKKLMYSLAERVTKAITNKEYARYICDAGTRNYSVSIKGDVYPCFIVTDEKDLCMGNVMDDNLFESEAFQKVLGKLEAFNKEKNEECKSCFIRKSCYACLGLNYIDTGDFSLKKDTCEMLRSMTERIIIGLYRMTLGKN